MIRRLGGEGINSKHRSTLEPPESVQAVPPLLAAVHLIKSPSFPWKHEKCMGRERGGEGEERHHREAE